MLTEVRTRWRYAIAGFLLGGPLFYLIIWAGLAAARITEGA